MAIKVPSIGDMVEYGFEQYEVANIAVGTPSKDSYSITNISVATGGKLALMLRSPELQNPFWVLADDCTIVGEGIKDDFFDNDARSEHLQDLGYNIVKWLDGLEDRPDNSKLPAIVSALMAIQYDKEGGYGSSWKGKGEYRGIMANIDRKYDRLDKMTQDELEGKIKSLRDMEEMLLEVKGSTESALKKVQDAIGESKIDAIADLTNYGLLYMTYVRDNFPNVFNIWVDRNIPKYLLDNLPLLQNDTEQL